MNSESDIAAAADVFQAHRDELGFVNRAQCEEGDLVTVERNGKIVGAALGNHCVQKPQTTLYELAVLTEFRQEGIGTELVNKLASESPHKKMVAKCPVGLSANEFYKANGWSCVDREDGKNRPLNIWECSISDSIDFITTGRPDLTAIAGLYGWLRGSRLDDIGTYENRDIKLDFIDIHWEDPNPDALLAATMRHRPKYVVAGDYDGQNYTEINKRASDLRRYAENVIIVPHEPNEVTHVPEWAIVGYSTPTGYAGTDAPIWEYYDRDIHILGGTIDQILKLYGYLGSDIVSIDTNSFHRAATKFAKWWGKTTPKWNRLAAPTACPGNVSKAYENTMLNMNYALREQGVIQ